MAQRKIWARIWLGVTLLLITGAHYFFFKFSTDRLNSYPISQGLTFGCVLWTTVLFGAMWLRYTWSRYVMITMICFGMIGFGVLAMLVRNDSVNPLPELMKLAVYGIGLYAIALVPLSASSTLRHFLGPKTAGER
jgi:hypothetical protein